MTELKAPDRSELFNEALNLDELIRHNKFDDALPIFDKLTKDVESLSDDDIDKSSIEAVLVNAEFRIRIIQQVQINAKKPNKRK